MSVATCSDYKCEWSQDEGEHSHIGVKPYLRRVVNQDGQVVDGKTGEPYKEEPSEPDN